MTQYIGILDGSGKTYGVRIPDLPGCYGGGATPEAAIADAMSAAREWIAQRETRGEAPPKARTMVQILKAGEINTKLNGLIDSMKDDPQAAQIEKEMKAMKQPTQEEVTAWIEHLKARDWSLPLTPEEEAMKQHADKTGEIMARFTPGQF